jgi:hypothetical protein
MEEHTECRAKEKSTSKYSLTHIINSVLSGKLAEFCKRL